MTISKLRGTWESEKNSYKTQELGSGVHSFIRECLESKDLFSLKEGALSSSPESRRNEYIHENKAKEKRRADFVIYIDSDILIPVEAERYENIEAGTEQLRNYQKDFERKYGILTDSYTWRFYNNNAYREFTLDQMLDETELFLQFWNEYIKPEFYYLSFFESTGQASLLRNTDKLPVEENRQLFFDDITALIRSFKSKLQIEGYLENVDEEGTERRAVEITYAYIIQFILYKTLVDNDFAHFRKEFANKTAHIRQHLFDKQYKNVLGIINGISAQIARDVYRPFSNEQEFIERKLMDLYHSTENSLVDVSPWLDIFVFVKKYDFSNVQNEIFGYIYENYLKELYEEKKQGQFFTHPAVVDFMLQEIGFTTSELQDRYALDKNSVSLIDPACGSGTFLYSATNRIIKAFGNHTKKKSKTVQEIVNQNVFGLDIGEFPLYLAEMNILMRLLPLIVGEKYGNPVDKKIKVFLTRDSIAEFMDTVLGRRRDDIDTTDGALFEGFQELDLGYKSYVREESDLEQLKQSLEDLHEVRRRRFDYVIGNPPYISYKMCSIQKPLFFELMKQDKAKLSNVYGMNLHSTPERPKRYPQKPNLYAFFIALGIALLKDNGKLCYIIPQTVLTAGDLDVVRYHIAKFTTLEKIILFSAKMFVGRGLRQKRQVPTSSLVLVLRRKPPSDTHYVEVIDHKNPNDNIEKTLENIVAGKRVSKKTILQEKLLKNTGNWNFIKQSKSFLEFHDNYKTNTADISIYYDHNWAEDQFGNRFYFDIGFTLSAEQMSTDQNSGDFYEVLDFKYFLGYSRFNPKTYYPTDKSKIKLTRNSQGYITLEQKYKIVWRIKNPDGFYFTDHNIIFSMGKASVICSNDKREILYLFSLLGSPVSGLVLREHLRHVNEKEYMVPIKAVKEFVRVPKITEDNQHIKEEVIGRTEEMLKLENEKLADFVDFETVLLQKFDGILTKDGNLVLTRENKKLRLPISEKRRTLVSKVIKEEYSQRNLGFEQEEVTLPQLKGLSIVDSNRQQRLKNYIDDLVFALYFKVPLDNLGEREAKKIRETCAKNVHYQFVNEKEL